MIFSELYFVSTSFGQFLILAITMVFLAALFFALKEMVRFLVVEKQELAQLKYNHLNLSPDADSNHKKFEALVVDVSDSLAQSRLRTLFNITSKDQPIHHESVIQTEYMQEKSAFASAFLRFARPAMIGLGLVGLLHGFTLMTGDLSLLFAENDTDYIRELFFPMQDGFQVLFWGLAGTVLLSIFQLPLNWLREQHFAKLEQFSTSHLIPLFNPPKEEKQLAQLIEEVRQHTQLVNGIAGKLERITIQSGQDLENLSQFTTNFKTGVESYMQGQELLHNDIVALSQLVANYKKQNDEGSKDSLRIVEALNLHNVTLDNINKKIYDTDFNMADWLKEIIALNRQQQEEFKENLKNTLDLTRSNLSNIQSASNRFRINIEKFEKTIENLQNHLSFFNSSIENASNNEVGKLNEVATKLQELTAIMSQVRTEVPDQLGRILQALQSTSKAADSQYVEQMAATIAERKIQETVTQYESETNRLKEEMQQMNQKKQGKFGNMLKGFLRLDD